ncbi:hypothetical protein [Gelatiniphilus marinus]|uniref:YARHG domain-containing protein n=1 Tax=Gelatiniphilus marinus TaxID=1759464 RepID=A0ABW5JM31_9FLAO
MKKKAFILIAISILSFNLSKAQKDLPLSSFDVFYIGMSEKEFRDSITSKYEINNEIVHTHTSFATKSVKSLDKYNLRKKTLTIKPPSYKLGNTGLVCNYIDFDFLNDRLLNIKLIMPDYKLSEEDINSTIKYLNNNYANEFKSSRHYKHSASLSKGHYVLHSDTMINDKWSDCGNSLTFRYTVKNKHKYKRENYLYLKDNEANFFWKYHILMTEEFESKSLKAYNAFRNVNLGGSLSDFLKTYNKELTFVPDSIVAKAYKNNSDVGVYQMHETYVDANPEPLPDVRLNEIQYFFYNGLLTTITLIIDPKVDVVKLENLLNQVYGPVDKIFSDNNTLRKFNDYKENLKQSAFGFSLQYYSGSKEYPPALTYKSDYLFNKCQNEYKLNKAESLKSAF